MIFNLASKYDCERLSVRIKNLMDKSAIIEVTEKKIRSHNQNSYLHLLIGIVALETGNTIDYTKEVYFKRLVNPDLFVIRKTDRLAGEVTILRSSADLSVEEMRIALDRWLRWGAENGFYFPQPGDEERLRDISVEMAKYKQYL